MAVVEAGARDAERASGEAAGLAHLAAVSFLASRLAPTAGFWVALAGGVAVARAAARRGLRIGTGTSFAGLAQSVAIMGPARISIPLTQALTAPLVGRMEARRAAAGLQVAAVAAIRAALALAWTALFIWVILGGLDAYTGGYDWVTKRLDWLPQGDAGALLLTVAGIAFWAPFASVVQVLVYRRGLRRWPEEEDREASGPVPDHSPPASDSLADPSPAALQRSRRGSRARVRRGPRARPLDPRAIALAACVAWALLLSSTGWALLAAVVAWLALAWALARPDHDFVPVGAAIAAALGLSAVIAGLVASLPLDVTLARAARAVLLVAVATWFRAAAGPAGIREVSRRVLGRLGRLVPGAREAAGLLGDLGTADVLLPAGRALVDELRSVRRRPRPALDAVLRWVAEESARFEPSPPRSPPRLRLRARDALLVLLAAAPLAALLTGAATPGSA